MLAGRPAVDRELVLAVLALLIGGVMVSAFAGWAHPRMPVHVRGPLDEERMRWAEIWLRLLPAAVVLGVLAGWALVEPEDAEPVPLLTWLLALPFAIVWLRALVRAGRSLVGTERVVAATVGILRPRIVIAPALATALDPAALAAVVAHEAAHARHRDPLRIWLAQLATDLQWPWPGPRRRLHAWLEALELARDAEARWNGANGEDLAAAIVAAARAGATPSLAALDGNGVALARRVAALLDPLPPWEARSSRSARIVGLGLIGALLASAVLLGAVEGESIVRVLLAGR